MPFCTALTKVLDFFCECLQEVAALMLGFNDHVLELFHVCGSFLMHPLTFVHVEGIFDRLAALPKIAVQYSFKVRDLHALKAQVRRPDRAWSVWRGLLKLLASCTGRWLHPLWF